MSFKVIQRGQTFDVYDGERLFTSCVYEPQYVRPFMGPVYTSFGESFTRFAEKHQEHPHQRSVFVGIGNVNGVDFWNEDGENKGKMVFNSVLCAEGGDQAVVSVKLIWKPIETDEDFLEEVRTLTFRKVGDLITVDVHLAFTASYRDITLGITKEAGPLGIRMADDLRADKGGSFTNSEGALNEEGCWSKEAKWCNYSGMLNGQKVGIAYYDKKTNPRYPAAWHIRNYGLMAANNFYFKGEEHIAKGDTLCYDFLLCFWEKEFDPKAFEE